MIEIGLMFYTKTLEQDILKMIERFRERMGKEPQEIWFDSLEQPETIAGLQTKFVIIPKDHYILSEKTQ